MKLSYLLILLFICSGLWCQFQWQEGGIPVNINYPLFWYEDSANVIDDITYIVWSESISGNPDLYVQGYDANGEQIWEEHHLVCGANKYQGRGKVIGSDNDNIIVAWHDTRNYEGLYYGDGYDIYLQKISPEGEHLWENELVLPQECNSYHCMLYPDQFGGCYAIYNSFAFHISSEGEIIPGWENGLQICNYYSNGQIVDSDGNLVVIYTSDGYSHLSKYSALGEIIWDNILLADQSFYPSSILELDNSIYIFSETSNTIFMQKVDENGEIWNEPLLLFEGESIITDIYTKFYSDGIYMVFKEYNTDVNDFMKLSLDGDILSSIDLNYWSIDGIHTLENDNLRFWGIHEEEMVLWEIDSDGALVSPEEGWYQFELQDLYWCDAMNVFSNNNQSVMVSRQASWVTEDEPLSFQIIDENGVNVCGEEGTQISAGKNDWQQIKNIYKVDDMEVVLLSRYTNYNEKVYMKLFDEDGNQIGDRILISHVNAKYTNPIKLIDNRLYFAGEIREGYDPYLYLNAVEFGDEPQLVWEDEGLYLGPGEFINNEISLEKLNDEENSLLCSWDFDGPYGDAYLQKITDDQIAWQSGGVVFSSHSGQIHTVRAYDDFLFQVISWGNGYYLNRVDEDGQPVWDNDIELTWESTYGFKAKVLDNGNLLMLRAEYVTNGLALIENRFTPDGENLSGSMGNVVAFLNEAEENFSIKFLEDSYIAVAQDDDEQIYLWRFDYSGEQIGELVNLPNPQNEEIYNYETIGENIAYLTYGLYGKTNLHLAGFDGTPSQIIPQNPYQVVEEGTYYNSNFFCKEDNDVYFCWMEGYASERPDEGEYGWDYYMQKLTIPTTSINEESVIPSISMELYPNPFNPELNISWNIDNNAQNEVDIAIYNTKGQKVQNWLRDSLKGSITWNGINRNGNACSSGLYYIKIKSGTESAISKTVLLK